MKHLKSPIVTHQHDVGSAEPSVIDQLHRILLDRALVKLHCTLISPLLSQPFPNHEIRPREICASAERSPPEAQCCLIISAQPYDPTWYVQKPRVACPHRTCPSEAT